jgi:hypothetical protein
MPDVWNLELRSSWSRFILGLMFSRTHLRGPEAHRRLQSRKL